MGDTLKELYSINEGLKYDKYLGNMIIYLKDKHNESNSLHSKIQSFLKVTLQSSRPIRVMSLGWISTKKPNRI